MKILKRIAIAIPLILILMQLYRPSRENPPVDQNMVIEKSMNVPPNIQAILSRSCDDCHSSKTVWPAYSSIAPISWVLAHHVSEGRRELNLSAWGTYNLRRKQRKLDEICEQVHSKEMPVTSYVWIHHEAALSDADRAALCDWAKAEKARLPAAPAGR